MATAAAAQPDAAPERLSTQMNRDDVIAKAGDLTVSVGDYLDAVRDYFSDRDTASAYEDEYEKEIAESIVRSIIQKQATFQVLHELGYDQQSKYQSALKMLQWRHLEEIDIASLPPFTEKDMTEAELRDAYDRYDIKPVENGISFRLIFLRTLGLDEQAAQAKRALAEATLKRIEDGESFFEVMKEVTEVADPRDTPYWVHETTKGFDPQIYQVLSGMRPGEVSPIIEAKAGLFILRRFPKAEKEELKPFDEMMADPIGRKRLSREALHAREMNKKNWLFEQIKDRYKAGAIETTDVATLMKLGDETPIMKVGDETLTLGDLKSTINGRLDQCSIDDINDQVAKMSKQMVFAQYAREKGLTSQLESLPAYRRDLFRLQQDYLTFTSRNDVPDMSEEAMQDFYDNHREELREMCRANAKQIHIKPIKADEGQKEVLALVVHDEAQRLKDLLEKGQTFEQVAGEVSGDHFEVEQTRWDDEQPSKIIFGDGKYGSSLLDEFGKILGPERVRDGFVIYSLTEQLPGKVIPFEQAKAQINQINKKQKAAEKINAVYQEQVKDLVLTESLLYIPDDLKPGRRK